MAEIRPPPVELISRPPIPFRSRQGTRLAACPVASRSEWRVMVSSAVTGDGGRLSLMIGQGDEAASASARSADQAITELYRLHYTKLVRLALLIVGEVPAAGGLVPE